MQKKKGISLIVLVITIIVMVILATAIIITLDNSGIINKANDAVEQSNLKQVQQLASLAWAEAYMDGTTTQADLEKAVLNALDNNKIDKSKYNITVTTDGVDVQLKNGELNEWGFYYGELYKAQIEDTGVLISAGFVFYENGTVEQYMSPNVYGFSGEGSDKLYCAEIREDAASYSKGKITMKYDDSTEQVFTVSSDGKSMSSDGEVATCTFEEIKGVQKGVTYTGKYQVASSQTEINTSLVVSTVNKGTLTYDDYEPVTSQVEYLGNYNLFGLNTTLGSTNTSLMGHVSIDGQYLLLEGNGLIAILKATEVVGDNTNTDVVTYNPGLYDSEDNLLIAWNDLVTNGTVHVDAGVLTTNFDEEAFANTSIETLAGVLKLPTDGSVTSIGDYAFGACGYMTRINIPDSVTSIGKYAFMGCRFEEITIPKGITTINEGVFYSCPNLKSITINGNITDIGDSAFILCVSLTNVTFASNSKLKTICDRAFQDCESLTSINIPSGVTSIGDSAFNGSSLTSIQIPSGVTSIGEFTFSDCPLTSIVIPSNVTSIGDGAFEGCYSLASITFESNSQLTSIGDAAFNACRSLTSIDIPTGVTSIGQYAFQETLITSIVVPTSVTTLDVAFWGCTTLISITMEAPTPPNLGGHLFDQDAQATIIYVPADSVDIYKAADFWKWYSDRIQAAP